MNRDDLHWFHRWPDAHDPRDVRHWLSRGYAEDVAVMLARTCVHHDIDGTQPDGWDAWPQAPVAQSRDEEGSSHGTGLLSTAELRERAGRRAWDVYRAVWIGGGY